MSQATIAAGNLRTDGQTQHDEVPVFWSNQFDHVIKSAGMPEEADSVVIAHGSLEDRAFVAVYGAADRIVGATTVDQVKRLVEYRRQIADGAPFPPEGRTIVNTSPGTSKGCPVSGPSCTATANWNRFLEHDNRADPYLDARLCDAAHVQRLEDGAFLVTGYDEILQVVHGPRLGGPSVIDAGRLRALLHALLHCDDNPTDVARARALTAWPSRHKKGP